MGYDGKYLGHNISNEVKKADIRARFNKDVECLKDSFKGSTYRGVYRDNTNGQVFAVVGLTCMDDGWFMVKLMDETYGPYYYDMPKSYMDMLTPIDNEFANGWRAKVYEYIEKHGKTVPMTERLFTDGKSTMTLTQIEEDYHLWRGMLTKSQIVRRQKVGGSFLLGGYKFVRTY